MNLIHNLWCRIALVLSVLFLALGAVIWAGSATTETNGVWVNPEAGKRARVSNVLVIAINRDKTARRIYEDTIVAQFAARGIKARASYKLLRELGAAPPPDIEMTVRKAGVDAVLISRTLRARTDIRVPPGYSYVPVGPVGFHGMWGTFSTAPNVYAVQSMEVETRLFDVKDLALLWSGSSTTNPSPSMQQTITELATALIKALADAKLIA
jgi:hypothetical protein